MIDIPNSTAFARAMDSPIDPDLKRVLRLRHNQLLVGQACDLADVAHFIAVEPFDPVPAIEAAAGYPLVTEPAFEWVADHSGILEAPVILDDDGYALVLFVRVQQGVDATLLNVLQQAPEMPPATSRIG
jgi:hypothetical protein